MFDIGWSELLMVAALAVIFIGPNELPGVMRMLGRVARRVSYIRYAFTQQFEDFMKEADLADIRKQVNFEEKDFDEAAADAEEMQAPAEKGEHET